MEQEKDETIEIICYPDPRLTAENEDIGEITDEVRDKVKKMFKSMFAARGMGLAAPQVGWNVRLFVMNVNGAEGNDVVCVNPEILEEEGETCLEEGCLSLPETRADVVRPERIKVEYTGLDGKRRAAEFSEIAARCFCHEFDHINGILFHTRLSPVEKTKVEPRLKALRKEFKAKRKKKKT